MADTSKKRSRKSKLVPRDCGENEGSKNKRLEEITNSLLTELETEARELDSLPNPLHTLLPKLRTELDRTYEEPCSSAADLQFSIKIEVEECDDDTDTPEESKPEDPDIPDPDIQIVEKTKKSDHEPWPLQISDTQYRTAVEKSSKITRSLADKILEVHINNYLGRFVNEISHEKNVFEKKVEDVLFYSRSWTKVSKLRDHILSYKCYVCDIGWWHLGPFTEHIKEHGEEVRLNFQTTPNEGCVVASLDKLDMKDIPIEGRCWQCLKTWDEHVNLKRNSFPYYNCPACTFRSTTCQPLFKHEGQCVRYQKEHIKDALNYDMTVCPICKISCLTMERYNLHMTVTHFVRSDFLCVPVKLKKCQQCSLKYVYYTIHSCSVKPLSATCLYCLRRFSSRFLAELHMDYSKKNVYCRICNAFLKSQCMEVAHVIKHTKNYVLLYTCLLCFDLYFNDEDMVKHHRFKVHGAKRNFSKNFFDEMVIVPRKLVPNLPTLSYNEDEMIAPIHPHILGPKLARIPKPIVNVVQNPSRGETESAVDTIRSTHLDVHGHDYLLRPYSCVEEPPMPTPKDSHQDEDNEMQLQQQEIDASIAAIASIRDVDIKTETDNHEYYDPSQMNIVYEDIEVKKEEFLDTLSNAFVDSESISENIDAETSSNVVRMYKQSVTIIKKENQVSDLSHDDNVDSNDVPCAVESGQKGQKVGNDDDFDYDDDDVDSNDVPSTEEESGQKGQKVENDDDSDDDIIEVKNSEADDVIELVSSSSSSDDDDELDDDVTIVKNEIIDLSDTEMPSNDDVNRTRNDELINESLTKARMNDVNESINENLAKASNHEVSDTEMRSDDDDDDVNKTRNDGNKTNNENLAEARNDEVSDTEIRSDDNDDDEVSDDEIKTNNEDEKAIDETLTATIHLEKITNKNAVIKINQETVVNATDDIDDEIYRVIKQENDAETSGEKSKKHKSKVRKQLIYECRGCDYKGVHRDYSYHKKYNCPRLKRKSPRKGDPSYIGGWSSYPCTKCDITFPSLKLFALHFSEDPHNLRPNTCPALDCNKVVKKYSLHKHLHTHINSMFTRMYILLEENMLINSTMDNVYQCKKCMEVVKYKKFFKHWEGHLREGPNREVTVELTIETMKGDKESLDDTELSQDTLTKLLDLLRQPIPSKTRNHTCALCSRSFSRGPYLKRHYVEHLLRDAIWRRVRRETANIACQLCREEFSNNLNYKQHMRNHASLPVYRCELCARGFSDSSNFAKHKKVHNMAAAVCDVCGSKFAKRESLVKHMKIHASDPLKCEACGKLFHTPNLYKKHLRNAHAEKPATYSCFVCLKKLPSTRERLDHLWTVHQIRNRRMDCPICSRSFRKFIDLKWHLHFKHNARTTLTSKQFTNATDDHRKTSLVDLGYRRHSSKPRLVEDEIMDSDLMPKADKVYRNKVKSEPAEIRDFSIENAESS